MLDNKDERFDSSVDVGVFLEQVADAETERMVQSDLACHARSGVDEGEVVYIDLIGKIKVSIELLDGLVSCADQQSREHFHPQGCSPILSGLG